MKKGYHGDYEMLAAYLVGSGAAKSTQYFPLICDEIGALLSNNDRKKFEESIDTELSYGG